MQTSFRGERSCKTASPLSSKASAAGRGGPVARAGERGGGGLNIRHLLPSTSNLPICKIQHGSRSPAPPRGRREGRGGGGRSRLHAGAVPSTPALTCNTEKVRGVEEGRDIALTSSWARRSKSIRRRRNSNQWRISSNR
jgi:hypothetical protein